jgi:hypothetical protein
MSYEVVTDLNYTPVLQEPRDKFSWANAGPGAKRGLNRIHGRYLEKSGQDWNTEMRALLDLAPQHLDMSIMPQGQVDMRMIEHSLCEFDKNERVRLGEGKPRSLYRRPK